MKLASCKNKITQIKDVPDLLAVTIENAVTSATATKCEYLGPVFPAEMWKQVLSFFAWTYTTYHSESQVRLYVNPKKDTWAAWAYPQEARTGMTAKELETPEAGKQRAARFKESEGWLYFGTAHHHCGSMAFQSGTDLANEESQDGIHITVGKIDEKRHDIHCRFYLSGYKFEPDMSLFWDIGEELINLLPESTWDQVARHQMCTPSKAEFPKEWKENIIEVKREVSTSVGYYSGGGRFAATYREGMVWDADEGQWVWPNQMGKKGKKGKASTSDVLGRQAEMPLVRRQEFALNSILAFCGSMKVSGEDLINMLNMMRDSSLCRCIMTALHRHNCEVDDVLNEIKWNKELRDLHKEQTDGNGNGSPGHDAIGMAMDEEEARMYGID